MAPDSPAARAGLEANMEIVSVDGERTATWQDLNMALAARLGDTGLIEVGATHIGSQQVSSHRVAIERWHIGVDEPDLTGSLGIEPVVPAAVGEVVEDSPASRAGIRADDRLVSLGGVELDSWRTFQDEIAKYPGQLVTMAVERGGQMLSLDITPEARAVGEETVGYLGVGPRYREIRFGPLEAVGEGIAKTGATVVLTFNLLKKMVFGQVALSNLSGPITIAKVAGDSARVGWKYFLGVLALLSVSLGALNLLPIPVLDGGHIVFAGAEWLRGKPVPERAVELGYQVGIFLVAGLMILALYNDVARLMS